MTGAYCNHFPPFNVKNGIKGKHSLTLQSFYGNHPKLRVDILLFDSYSIVVLKNTLQYTSADRSLRMNLQIKQLVVVRKLLPLTICNQQGATLPMEMEVRPSRNLSTSTRASPHLTLSRAESFNEFNGKTLFTISYLTRKINICLKDIPRE